MLTISDVLGLTASDIIQDQFHSAEFLKHKQSQSTVLMKLDTAAASNFLREASVAHKNLGAPGLILKPKFRDGILANVCVADVNEFAVRLLGANANRENVIGRPILDFWPSESITVLFELVFAAITHPREHGWWTSEIASYGLLLDPVVTIHRSAKDIGPETLLLAIDGNVRIGNSFATLQASEEHYRKLFHYIPTALLRVDANGMVERYDQLKAEGVDDLDLYLNDHPELIDVANDTVRVAEANRSAVSLLGGSALSDCVGPVGFLFQESPETARRIMVARFNGTSDYSEIMKLRTFDNRQLDVLISLSFPSQFEERDVLFISLEDVTERLRTEALLRQVQTDFTHAARISTLGELATSIAHEINQPLAAIVTNAETSIRWLAREDPNLLKIEQLISRIATSARRASDIVQRIRGMAAKRAPERALVDLNDVVNEALLFVRHDIDIGSIDVSVKLFSSLPRVNGDRILLQQVVVNLLLNSLHAVEQSTGNLRRIELTTDTYDDFSVVVSIHDSGAGIAKNDLNRVFDAFFTTKESGIGIGLAVCQSIVKAHGGKMSVSNHSSGGAHFSFLIPIAFPAYSTDLNTCTSSNLNINSETS